jgi:hypothetical protein
MYAQVARRIIEGGEVFEEVVKGAMDEARFEALLGS